MSSIQEFINEKEDNTYENLQYNPDTLISTASNKITFEEKTFKRVSFSKTIIKKVKFLDCTFEDCLFLSTSFEDCTFSNCTFKGCNTSSSKWMKSTSIDPKVFKDNFDFKQDVNIAIKLFIELMKLYEENHQVDREKDARYLYLKASHNMIYYHYNINKDINKKEFYLKKIGSSIHDFVSGYGIYKKRIIRSFLIFLVLISLFNYLNQNLIFDFVKLQESGITEYSFIQSMYFSFITITTIGYGDISPSTAIGQLIIMFESLLGIILIALSLNMFSNGK